jgi:(p)ppGpp synthase/HD superfamily hydrolase
MTNESDKSIIDIARDFAIKAHGDQLYGEQSYLSHLESVHQTLREFGCTSEEMLCAAYLHDTIEDTTVSYTDIKKMFGKDVAEIVFHVTDELGRNRKERHEKTYPKTALMPRAVTLKLADRISNVRQSKRNGQKLEMYRSEYPFFRKTLNDGSSNQKMWDELDSLMDYHA